MASQSEVWEAGAKEKKEEEPKSPIILSWRKRQKLKDRDSTSSYNWMLDPAYTLPKGCTCTPQAQDVRCTAQHYVIEDDMKEEENADDEKTEEEEENVPATPPKSKPMRRMAKKKTNDVADSDEEIIQGTPQKPRPVCVLVKKKREEEGQEQSQSLLAIAKKEARDELIFLGFNSRNVKN